jgi:hypothetical protein
LWFFALDYFSNLEDGSLFTAERVVTYRDGTNPWTVEEARFGDIEDINLDEEFNWYSQARIIVKRKNGSSFSLRLLKTHGADRFFLARLREQWNMAKSAQ